MAKESTQNNICLLTIVDDQATFNKDNLIIANPNIMPSFYILYNGIRFNSYLLCSMCGFCQFMCKELKLLIEIDLNTNKVNLVNNGSLSIKLKSVD